MEAQQHRAIENGRLKPTGERCLPWANDPVIAYEHLHRYAYACRHAAGKSALDLACGEGYGSSLLARTARLTIGIDIDEKTVHHAHAKYAADSLHFAVGSATEIPLAERFDIIACFELIEHIRDHDKLLSEIKRVLAPEGLLVISTPNKPVYRLLEPSNPFHVNELDFEEFRALLARFFRQVKFLGQRVYCNSNLWPFPPKSSGMGSVLFMDRNAEEFFVLETDRRSPLYFIAIASDAEELPVLDGEVMVDISNALLEEKDRIRRELEETIGSQREALAWREGQVRQFQSTIGSHEQALAWRASQINDLQDKIRYQQLESDSQKKQLDNQGKQLASQRRQIEELEKQMYLLRSSRAWKLIQRFYRIRDRALPPRSARRRFYDRLIGKIKL